MTEVSKYLDADPSLLDEYPIRKKVVSTRVINPTHKCLRDPAAMLLLKAADLIEQHGWWDGKNWHVADQRLCASTAITAAAVANQIPSQEMSATLRAAQKRLWAFLQVSNEKAWNIPYWNDRSNKATVVATLRRAASF